MTRHLLLLIITCGLGLSAICQQVTADKIPANVLVAYKKQFPQAEKTRWGLMGDSVYAVCFTLSDSRHFAKCDKDGNWLQHDSNIGYSALPEPVKQATQLHFPEFEVRYVSRFESVDTEVVYKLALIKGKESRTVRFSPKGEVLTGSNNKISN
jgi:hypothetical protein